MFPISHREKHDRSVKAILNIHGCTTRVKIIPTTYRFSKQRLFWRFAKIDLPWPEGAFVSACIAAVFDSDNSPGFRFSWNNTESYPVIHTDVCRCFISYLGLESRIEN